MTFEERLARQVRRILGPSLAAGLALGAASCGANTRGVVEEPQQDTITADASNKGFDNDVADALDAPDALETPDEPDAQTPPPPDAGPGDDDAEAASMCAEATPPDGFMRQPGFIIVGVDDPCPDEYPSPLLVSAYDCCPTLSGRELCGFVERQENVPPPTFGGALPPPEETRVSVCVYDVVFEVGGACCGRPLLEAGHAVLAQVIRGRDLGGWSAASPPRLAPENAARRAAGEYWLEAALMEHASVASFSRFAIDLMKLGAPAELIARAHQAALDEIEHARLCFDLAGGFFDAPVSPGPLPLGDRLTLSADRLALAEAVAIEGCIGETLAALEAAARLRHADESEVCAALHQIIDDESAHAALGWATIEWLLSEDDSGAIRARLDAIFDRAPTAQGGLAVVPEGGERLGLISDAQRRTLFDDGWRRVVAPAWARCCPAA